MHLLCATHTLAPVGALSAQIPTRRAWGGVVTPTSSLATVWAGKIRRSSLNKSEYSQYSEINQNIHNTQMNGTDRVVELALLEARELVRLRLARQNLPTTPARETSTLVHPRHCRLGVSSHLDRLCGKLTECAKNVRNVANNGSTNGFPQQLGLL